MDHSKCRYKANYAISSKVGLMVGAFNSYTADAFKGLNAVGAQLSLNTY
jgi:hypothetical protein